MTSPPRGGIRLDNDHDQTNLSQLSEAAAAAKAAMKLKRQRAEERRKILMGAKTKLRRVKLKLKLMHSFQHLSDLIKPVLDDKLSLSINLSRVALFINKFSFEPTAMAEPAESIPEKPSPSLPPAKGEASGKRLATSPSKQAPAAPSAASADTATEALSKEDRTRQVAKERLKQDAWTVPAAPIRYIAPRARASVSQAEGAKKALAVTMSLNELGLKDDVKTRLKDGTPLEDIIYAAEQIFEYRYFVYPTTAIFIGIAELLPLPSMTLIPVTFACQRVPTKVHSARPSMAARMTDTRPFRVNWPMLFVWKAATRECGMLGRCLMMPQLGHLAAKRVRPSQQVRRACDLISAGGYRVRQIFCGLPIDRWASFNPDAITAPRKQQDKEEGDDGQDKTAEQEKGALPSFPIIWRFLKLDFEKQTADSVWSSLDAYLPSAGEIHRRIKKYSLRGRMFPRVAIPPSLHPGFAQKFGLKPRLKSAGFLLVRNQRAKVRSKTKEAIPPAAAQKTVPPPVQPKAAPPPAPRMAAAGPSTGFGRPDTRASVPTFPAVEPVRLGRLFLYTPWPERSVPTLPQTAETDNEETEDCSSVSDKSVDGYIDAVPFRPVADKSDILQDTEMPEAPIPPSSVHYRLAAAAMEHAASVRKFDQQLRTGADIVMADRRLETLLYPDPRTRSYQQRSHLVRWLHDALHHPQGTVAATCMLLALYHSVDHREQPDTMSLLVGHELKDQPYHRRTRPKPITFDTADCLAGLSEILREVVPEHEMASAFQEAEGSRRLSLLDLDKLTRHWTLTRRRQLQQKAQEERSAQEAAQPWIAQTRGSLSPLSPVSPRLVDFKPPAEVEVRVPGKSWEFEDWFHPVYGYHDKKLRGYDDWLSTPL
ncbi:unnamed protein product [Vitrella brassicaformis CCMP3155]|uniref:Uncharacterized protein n=2 Tax=Vitrella brassicaformis TaxID=1169539 RepID=A0A0G4ELK1_VITBC|nr:unnamed protein product [Vitrella brassicaformis CCMP3155]|eukprot:CEL97889.1 unnamed protein product [Vitrella brassicaformis CCMP3155]